VLLFKRRKLLFTEAEIKKAQARYNKEKKCHTSLKSYVEVPKGL